jgi:hypothetical protein
MKTEAASYSKNISNNIQIYTVKLINKTTNVMQLGAIVFIIPWKALCMFQVLFAPIIRSVLKLYMQL